MITDLETRIENLKEKFRKEEIVLVFAKFEADGILEQTELALSLLSNVDEEDRIRKRFVALHNQVKEFVELLNDLIDEKLKII